MIDDDITTGRVIALQGRMARAASARATTPVRVVPRASRAWWECIELVRRQFATQHGADVDPCPDMFVTYCASEPAGDILACVGVTRGSAQPFFSEVYLDEPIETLVARIEGTDCSRDEIAEFGALASRGARAGVELVRHVPATAWRHGHRFVLITATAAVVRCVERVGIRFVPIAAADPARLSAEDRRRWGTYYETRPLTGYLDIASSLAGGDVIRLDEGRPLASSADRELADAA